MPWATYEHRQNPCNERPVFTQGRQCYFAPGLYTVFVVQFRQTLIQTSTKKKMYPVTVGFVQIGALKALLHLGAEKIF
jgi:hypothetical protein